MINMDSNGSNQDITEESNKMEASDSNAQDKSSEHEVEDVSSEKLVTEKSCENEDVESLSLESDKVEGDILTLEEVKINTLQTDYEAEKLMDDDKPNHVVTSSDKDSDVSESEALELKLVSPEIPKDDEDTKDSTCDVNNKDIKSTKDAMDVEDSCDKAIVTDAERSLEEQKVENLECLSDNKDVGDEKLTPSTSTEKEEDTKTVNDEKDSKEMVKDTEKMIDTDNNTVDLKDIKDEQEIKNIANVNIDDKEMKENKEKIEKTVEGSESNELKMEVDEKIKDIKTLKIKEIKKPEEPLEERQIIAIKVNKASKDIKGAKEEKDLSIVKKVQEAPSANMSMNTREGKRKRRMIATTDEQSSLTAEQQPLSQKQQQQQQQNGSATKRKRTAAAASANSEAEPTTPTSEEAAPAEAPSKNDRFCWRCHKESVEMQCSACPRSWHRRCMGGAPPLSVIDWLCSECTTVIEAESAKSRSPATEHPTVDQLVVMLKHVVQRMREQTGSEPFLKAVDSEEVPNYLEYVINPMDLSLLESNIRAKKYASTDAFMADAKWIQHNCIVFNTYSSKLTNTAKQMLKVARQEVSEIEACPDCFAHGRNLPKPLPSWFIEPCRRPHPIVWAKLKGFPFWPAKAMPRLNAQGYVDVRFFGEHDRAWVAPKDIYLYSTEPPAGTPKKKKFEMEQCIKEVQAHVKKIERVFGEFQYAPSKVQYDPHDLKQIQLSLPNYDPIENKINKKENPKTEDKILPEKKLTQAKVEKKSIPKNSVVPNTNGVVVNTPPLLERRKLLRKKRVLSPQIQEAPVPKKTAKLNPEVETIVVIPPKKSKSKSPPAAATPIVNNVESKSSNKEVNKSSSTSETTPKVNASNNSNNNGIQKPTLVPVRKVKRSEVVKKIKLTKESSKFQEPIRKPMVVVKTLNISKPATIIHSMPPLNNFPDNIEATPVKILGTTKKLVSILPKKNQNSTGTVMNAKTIQVIQQDGKVVNRVIKTITVPISKEASKYSLVPTSQLKEKNDTSSNSSSKPMTAIPITSNKDQKNIFSDINSTLSETAKHFSNGEKEIRLNSAVTIIKQEPKDDVIPLSPTSGQTKLTIVRKPGKARKSFSNRPPPFPQQAASSPSTKSSSGSTNEKTSYIPGKQGNDARSTSSMTNSTSAIVSSSSSSGSAYELPPAEAGPATAQVHQYSKDLASKLAQFITDTIKESAESNGIGVGSNANNHEATIHYLKLKMERMKWEHDQEINEIKHNHELKLRELKNSLELEHHRALESARREADVDKRRSIEETKRKQWCVVCGREAVFFCCWNTAYCDYPCQQKHWAAHVNNCAQKNPPSSQSSATSAASTPRSQTQRHSSGNAAKQQVMPKLVISKPQSMPAMRKASS